MDGAVVGVRRGWIKTARWTGCLIFGAALQLTAALHGQTAATSIAPAVAAESQTVTGRVLDGQSRAPVARALVTVGTRSVLTDALGRFTLPLFTAAQGTFRVTRPGYLQTLNGESSTRGMTFSDFSSPVELTLYRDALITGVVSGSDRTPISRAQVQLYRQMGADQEYRMVPIGLTTTDVHGQYRFEESPGRYRISLRYSQHATPTGEAMLPVDFPESNGAETPAVFHVGSGQERRVDLQARTSPSFPVLFAVDGADRRANLRVTARFANGTAFAVSARPAGGSESTGEFRVDLPSGTYRLIGVSQGRDARLEGETRVTVINKTVSGLTMHLIETPAIPVEVAVDSGPVAASNSSVSAVAAAPTVESLNLRLQNIEPQGDFGTDEIKVSALDSQRYAILAGSGVYRLRGQAGGAWYIRSASYGTTDLLTQRLVVTPGAGGEPIRIVVSSDSGQLSGTVTLGGAASSGTVYLLPHEPSLVPVRTVRAGSDGSFSTKLPPGTYTALAFDQTFAGDLRNEETAARLAGAEQTTEISSGGTSTLKLAAVAVETLR